MKGLPYDGMVVPTIYRLLMDTPNGIEVSGLEIHDVNGHGSEGCGEKVAHRFVGLEEVNVGGNLGLDDVLVDRFETDQRGLHTVEIGGREQSNHGVGGITWIGRSDDEREWRNPDAFGTVISRVSVTGDFLDLLGLEEGWKRYGVVAPVNVIEFVEVKDSRSVAATPCSA